MTTVIDQNQFVTTYLQLVSLDEAETADFYNTASTYNTLETLGPSLPPIKTRLPTKSQSATNTVDLSFKSIKPPYRFNETLAGVSTSTTIYKVKLELIQKLSLPLIASDVKFLIKGKVIQDLVVLSELDSYSFTCFVSAPKPAANASDDGIADMDIDELRVSDSAWNKILSILIEDGKSQEKANDIVSGFKRTLP